jgi:hypothetical protein
MSRFNEITLVGLLTLALAPSVGWAALESSEAPARAIAVTDLAPSKPKLEQSAPARAKRQVFKCWQYGKLIYEGSGGSIPLDRSQVSVRLPVGTSIQVYDLKSATCILEQPES